jgi:hypothetical protein
MLTVTKLPDFQPMPKRTEAKPQSCGALNFD